MKAKSEQISRWEFAGGKKNEQNKAKQPKTRQSGGPVAVATVNR